MGATEVSPDACAEPSEVKIRACRDDCRWGADSECSVPVCEMGSECSVVGEQRTGQRCGFCGTRTESCGLDCTWIRGVCEAEVTDDPCTPGQKRVTEDGCESGYERHEICAEDCRWSSPRPACVSQAPLVVITSSEIGARYVYEAQLKAGGRNVQRAPLREWPLGKNTWTIRENFTDQPSAPRCNWGSGNRAIELIELKNESGAQVRVNAWNELPVSGERLSLLAAYVNKPDTGNVSSFLWCRPGLDSNHITARDLYCSSFEAESSLLGRTVNASYPHPACPEDPETGARDMCLLDGIFGSFKSTARSCAGSQTASHTKNVCSTSGIDIPAGQSRWVWMQSVNNSPSTHTLHVEVTPRSHGISCEKPY